MASPVADLGNGIGWIYTTAADGTTIVRNNQNTYSGRSAVQIDALTRAPLSGATAAVGSVTYATAPANVTGLTVNAVSIISGTVAAGGTLALTADAVASNINAYTSVPNYHAIAVGTTVYIIADDSGSAPNGFVVAGTVAAGMTATYSNMANGANVTGTYDVSGQGRRYFLDANYGASAAVAGTIGASAVEITQYLNLRGLQSAIPSTSVTIASGVITITRTAAIMNVVVDTEGAAASDDLNTIVTTGFNQFDILILRGANSARVVTVKNYVGGSDNIGLANSTDFLSGTNANTLALQYMNTGAGANWYENSRSPNLGLTVANIRASGIAEPVQGVNVNTMGTSGTTNFEPGVDKGYQVITGNPVLIGGVVYQIQAAPATPYLDGDELMIDYRATPTVGAFSVTLGTITLTAAQAAGGAVRVLCKYRLSTTTWYYTLLPARTGVDFATTAQLATYEPVLGNPAANGYILSSTTGGVRTWIALQNQIQPARIVIPTASVLTGFATPIQVVAAPGAGNIIEIVSCFVHIDFNTTAYATNLTTELYYTGASVAALSTGNILNATVDTKRNFPVTGTTTAGATQMMENAALMWRVGVGNPTLGDSDIVLFVQYRIVAL